MWKSLTQELKIAALNKRTVGKFSVARVFFIIFRHSVYDEKYWPHIRKHVLDFFSKRQLLAFVKILVTNIGFSLKQH